MTVGVRKIPKWESELWGYLSSGDGGQCPSYSYCQNRLEGGWCPSDNLDLISRLLDDKRFSTAKYAFVGGTTRWEYGREYGGECGRVFQLVERLAEEYLKKAGVHCPPVPGEIVSLADEQHTIEVRPVALKSHHGSIWRLGDEWVIQLSDSDTPGKRRLALFHEAFHILAHRRTTPVFRKSEHYQGSFNELLADYFAGCILMPRTWVRKKWSEVKDLCRMAEIFDVEKPLMWIRLREIGLI